MEETLQTVYETEPDRVVTYYELQKLIGVSRTSKIIDRMEKAKGFKKLFSKKIADGREIRYYRVRDVYEYIIDDNY